MSNKKHALFSVFGIECEYMIVNQSTLEIMPITDRVIEMMAGEVVNEVERGDIAINNELVLHVIEFKTNGPVKTLRRLDEKFHQAILDVNQLLSQFHAKLMPTGAHPLLRSSQAIKLWPHGDQVIYDTYHRIFNCVGHGWSNLQSVHVNLPFANDNEFFLLHSAIRLLLPIIPALTASTPYIEGKSTGYLDTRLIYYGANQKLLPIIAGNVIPEFIQSPQQYHDFILNKVYAAIAPHDPDKVLQKEWLNSRGAIARFDRNAVEIRVLDSQESVKAEVACAATVIGVLQYIMQQTEDYIGDRVEEQALIQLYHAAIKTGMNTVMGHHPYSRYLNIKSSSTMTLNQLWEQLISAAASFIAYEHQVVIEYILSQGNLAERLLKICGHDPSELKLIDTYHKLSDCLNNNTLF